MSYLDKILFFGFILAIFHNSNGNLSVEQFTISMDMIRDACMDQFKSVTKEKLADMKNKKFMDKDEDLKCYMNCFWEGFGAMNNGAFNKEEYVRQVERTVPKEWQGDYKKGSESCKDAGKGKSNPCDVAYENAKCFINNVPSFYV